MSARLIPTSVTRVVRWLAVSPAADRWLAAVAAMVAAAVVLPRLGGLTLASWDEAIYALVARQMVRDGDWLIPHQADALFIERPPLYSWCVALLFRLFGVGELWARLPSAGAAIGLAATVYLIGTAAYGRAVGLLGAAILVVSHPFVRFGRFGTTDMMLVAGLYLAVYGYLRAAGGRPSAWYLASGGLGLAVMVKGVAALPVAVALALGAVLDGVAGSAIRSSDFRRGALLFLAIVVPWHVQALLRYPDAFLSSYLGFNVLGRATTAIDGHAGDASFYLQVLNLDFVPWTYLLPVALAYGLWEACRGGRGARTLLLVGMLEILILTAMTTKTRWYLLPAYPAFCILIAAVVVKAFARPGPLRPIALGGAALFAVANQVAERAVLYLGMAVFLVCFTVGTALTRRAALVGVTAVCTVLSAVMLAELYPVGAQPVATLGRIARPTSEDDRETLLVASGLSYPAARFYADRPITVVRSFSDLQAVVDGRGRARIILDRTDLASVGANYQVEIVAEAEPLVLGWSLAWAYDVDVDVDANPFVYAVISRPNPR